MKVIIIYLIIINIATFIVYGVDKAKAAAGAWRIREAVLLGMAFVGGSLGALLGMLVFRHKINKNYFKYGVPAMLCLHVLLLIWLVSGSR